jgi:hypothetical protein
VRRSGNWRTLLTALAAAALGAAGAWTTHRLGLNPGWQRLILGGMLIGAPYLLALLILDSRLRALIRPTLRAVEQRVGVPG